MGLIGLEPARLRGIADDLGSGVAWWEAVCATPPRCGRHSMSVRRPWVASTSWLRMRGVAAYGTVRQADEASFERVVDINLTGVFRTLKYATPHLERSGGHVLVVASALSFAPLGALASYGASKAGVEMLALAYRQEVAHLGVTVGVVHPSWIDTDLVRSADVDLPSFALLRRGLPYPGNVTTSVDQAAAAVVDGLERCRRRVYVPRAVGVANWAKGALNSPVTWPWMRRFAARAVPALEREVAALGRHDQLVPVAGDRVAAT
ncbi:MAG TPA: SDR family NAD(P)-dependent oxidoreductase [Jiangellaceae bacterium]|nr:SDR family NAD(P)-dependent oxidoreductase [Jiangellaceae bacterium]